MTNEQKAQRLEQMAKWADKNALRWKDRAVNCGSHPRESEGCMALSEAESADAALLREAADMMRSRPAVEWVKVAGSASRQVALYRGWILEVGEGIMWNWSADSAKGFDGDEAPTLEAAQSAAVAWVDGQEGRDA